MFNSSENFVIGIAKPIQYGFQPAYSPVMEGIVDLHHYICFFLAGILTFVMWMLFFTVFQYSYVSISKKTSNQHVSDVRKKKNLNIVGKALCAISNWIGSVDYEKHAKTLSHWTSLEVIWTVLPSFILFAIAVPSFVLLYSMDELTDDVAITIKVIGHQCIGVTNTPTQVFLIFLKIVIQLVFTMIVI